MWDDEDNNPYGSFNRRNSDESDVPGMAHQTRTIEVESILSHTKVQ